MVQGSITITVKENTARVDADDDKIYLCLGTEYSLSEGSCFDAEHGYSFWNQIPIDNCKFDKYSILYEGPVEKLIDYNYNHVQTLYSISSKDMTFALTSKSTQNLL